MEHSVEYLHRQAPSVYGRELVEQIFNQTYCRNGDLVDAGIGQREIASEQSEDPVRCWGRA